MAGIRSILDNLRNLKKEFLSLFPKEQAVSFSNLYERVWNVVMESSMESDEWSWLVDLFVDENTGALSALFAREGKLYLSSVTVTDSDAVLGEMVEVKQTFEPVVNQMLIRQSSDGKYRWFLSAASTVLNRMGYFNSQELFDNLIQKCEQSGKYPYLTIFHLGEALKMGMTDWVGRSENILIASGTFDDSDLAELMRQSMIDDPDYWGASISFWPLGHRMLEIAQGIELPVYTDGEFEEISILSEPNACCLMTAAISQVRANKMDERLLADLKKLANGDEATLQSLIARVDGANEKIRQEGLLHQSTDPVEGEEVIQDGVQGQEGEGVIEAGKETEEVETPVIEIGEELIGVIVQKVLDSEVFKGVNDRITQLLEKLDGVELKLTSASAELQTQGLRIQGLEKPVEQKKTEWLNDLPRNATAVRVVHRPSEQVSQGTDPEPAQRTAADIAAETLSRLG